MKKRVILIVIGVILALVLLAIFILSRVSISIGMSFPHYGFTTLDELITNSEYIALVEVGNIKMKANYEKPKLLPNGEISICKTYDKFADLKIIETYKGNFEDDNITYKRKSMDAQPEFEKGDRIILFMNKEPDTNTYYIYHGIQGKFVYDQETNTYKNCANVSFVNILDEIEKLNIE